MQHIEEAGVHSGDSACVIPPHSLPAEVIDEIKRQTRRLARELNVKGLMNVQFAIQTAIAGRTARPSSGDGPPSRSTFSKSIRAPAARCRSCPRRPACRWPAMAALVMVGKTLDELGLFEEVVPTHFLGQGERVSLQQVPRRGHHSRAGDALDRRGDGHRRHVSRWRSHKSQLAANAALPASGTIFISVADRDKKDAMPIARSLASMGYQLISTRGTAQALRAAGIEVEEIPKLQEGRPNLIDHMKNNQIALVINTPSGKGARTDEGKIRAAAVMHRVTCITTLAAAQAAAQACQALRQGELTVKPLQDWYR